VKGLGGEKEKPFSGTKEKMRAMEVKRKNGDSEVIKRRGSSYQ